jgi:hypothetical protein
MIVVMVMMAQLQVLEEVVVEPDLQVKTQVPVIIQPLLIQQVLVVVQEE